MPSLSSHLAAHEAAKAQKEMFAAHSKAVGQDMPTAPAIFGCSVLALQTIVPVVLVLVTCAPAWWPVLCEKVRSLRSALSMENLRRVLREQWPEIIGLFSSTLILLLGLLAGSLGNLASNKELDVLGYSLHATQVVEMQKLWAWILHPDSLVVMQQLLRALGAALLVYRGAAASGGGAFFPAFMQLAGASGMRLLLWITTTDYQLEGPLAGKFAGGCAALAFGTQLLAAYKAMQAARNTSSRSKRILGFQYLIQVFLCVWAACMNHFTLGHTDLANVVFSAIDAADLSAAPIFCIAACVGASENAPSVVGSMHVHLLAQLLGFYWYLDFARVAGSPDSTDPSIKYAFGLSNSKLNASIYGDPLSLMMVAHCIQLFAMAVSCLASSGFSVGIQSNRPKAAPKQVIEKLDLVKWTSEVFADDPNACCAICLGDFAEGDELRRLPCQHQQFHASCVDHWLSKAGRCPLCVADIQAETKKES
jgi:hypothetical protein